MPAAPWPGFPRQNAKLVAEVVGASHGNEAKVKALITANPALVNAWWDWGFGDWESPLGAASHVGNRPIAEFLLERGARIDIFAAAMLGHTDVVKAFVVAQPGIQRSWGPHGITLYMHAKVGGPKAADTLSYLESLGDSNIGPKSSPLPDDQKAVYLGKYISKPWGIRWECKLNRNGLMVMECQPPESPASSRNLIWVEGREFFPAGVPTVKFQFRVEAERAVGFTVSGIEPAMSADRE